MLTEWSELKINFIDWSDVEISFISDISPEENKKLKCFLEFLRLIFEKKNLKTNWQNVSITDRKKNEESG